MDESAGTSFPNASSRSCSASVRWSGAYFGSRTCHPISPKPSKPRRWPRNTIISIRYSTRNRHGRLWGSMAKFPEPEVGLVISYAYLWFEEAERGQVEGRKDRPCAIIVAVDVPDEAAGHRERVAV